MIEITNARIQLLNIPRCGFDLFIVMTLHKKPFIRLRKCTSSRDGRPDLI